MRWTRHPALVTLFISLLAANWLLATELPFRGIAYTSYQTGEYPVTTSWIPQTWWDSQGLTATTVTTENSHRGRGSLMIDFDVTAQHPNRSKGEVYVDMRDKPPLFSPPSCWYAPFDLLQQRVTVMVYVTSEMFNDDTEHPNGLQIFFNSVDDDDNWRSFYGMWHNITIADVDTWKEISATPSTTKPPGGYIHPQFDPQRIVSVGVKFGTGDESNFNNSGSFFIDDLDWPGGVDPEYGFENVDDSLATLVAANAKDASVLVTWYMETLTSNEIARHPDRTHSDEEIRELIDLLHGLGIDVMLKPHVDVLDDDDDDDDDDTWRGFIQPEDVDQWFDAYTAFITHYAEIADELNVELFCVGTEFESLSDSEFVDYWRNVIADVAAIYDGELTYAANWNGYAQASYLVKRNPDLLKTIDIRSVNDGFKAVSFWELLDYAGIDAYFPLSDQRDPSLATLIEGWTNYNGRHGAHNWMQEVEAFANDVEKPILFTEIGYASRDYSTREPWTAGDPSEGDIPNADLQARAYQAAFRVFQNKPWFKGFFWWNWMPWSDAGGSCDLGLTPQNKRAEQVLRVRMGEDDTSCLSGSTALCLNHRRFRVEVDWRDFQGNTGSGQVVPFGAADSGLFWFFDPDNWEMLVKVLNGCGVNDRFWVFSAATTNVEYHLRVEDTVTGVVWTHHNPLGTAAPAITDTDAFATCASGKHER